MICSLLAILCVSSGQLLGHHNEQTVKQKIATESEPWKLAVVFSVSSATRTYRGVISKPIFTELSTDDPKRHPASSSHNFELWLLRDGQTKRLWYDSVKRRYGELAADGRSLSGRLDSGGNIGKMVASCSRLAKSNAVKTDSKAYATWPPPPRTLHQLTASSHVIASGLIVGVLRQEHSPIGSSGYHQHTVYAFVVEDYLKRDSESMPRVLKVWQNGGGLPWVNSDGSMRGLGYVLDGDPLLNVGDRYILFLSGFKHDPVFQRTGYVPIEVRGVRGKDAELDEYRSAHQWRGKLLLRQGFTRLPVAPDSRQHHPWSFDNGSPQILNVREQDAFAAIRNSVSRSP